MENVIQQQQPESGLTGNFREYLPTHSNWRKILVKTEWQGIRYLREELSDAWQWDLAYESRAWIEAESHWNEYDQMDVWG